MRKYSTKKEIWERVTENKKKACAKHSWLNAVYCGRLDFFDQQDHDEETHHYRSDGLLCDLS